MTRADYQIDGLEIKFYPNDHDPEHFHVLKKGEWEIKVFFRLCDEINLVYELKWKLKSLGPSSNDKKRICNYVEKCKDHLEREWKTKVCEK